MELGTPINVLLEPLDLGLVPLFLLLRLGLSIGDLILQLQVLKNEQLEKLATLVVRLLRKATRARLKRSRGLVPEFRITEEVRKCKKRLRDCPSLPSWLSGLTRKWDSGTGGPECFQVVLMFISF